MNEKVRKTGIGFICSEMRRNERLIAYQNFVQLIGSVVKWFHLSACHFTYLL